MLASLAYPSVVKATQIPYVIAQEAHVLLLTELERFLRLIEQLEPADWTQPTACTAWTVRDMLAHQSASYAGGASLIELLHQLSRPPRKGQLPEDAINAIQQRDRMHHSPAELITELRRTGPVAARKWAYGYSLLKLFSIPHAVAGKLPLRHLMWVTHSRDTWMHRLDICRATGQAFEQTTEHDGRIAALVMLDVADALARHTTSPALIFHLTGTAGGVYQIGAGEPTAAIRMEVLDFNIFASGRYSYQQARPLMEITGDVQAAENALRKLLIVY